MRVPPFFDIVLALPGLGSAAHGRLRLLWVLAVAVAAGLSLESLVQERRWAAGGTLAVAALALILAPPPGEAFWQQTWWVATLLGTVSVLAVMTVPHLRVQAPWVAVGALILDLAVLGVRYHPVLPARFDLPAPPVLRPVIEESARSLAAARPFRIAAEGWDFYSNLAARNPQALPLFFFPASLRRSPDLGEVAWWTVINRDFRARVPVEAGPGEPGRGSGWREAAREPYSGARRGAALTCCLRNSGAKSAPFAQERVWCVISKRLNWPVSFKGPKTGPSNSLERSISPAVPSLNRIQTVWSCR
jgi:hypothetical protein